MSSKGRQIAKNIGKSIKKKFDVDFFQFPFGFDDQQKEITFLPQGSPTFTVHKIQKMQSSPRSPRKSNSLSTITATEASDPTIVDHDEIIALTHDVKKFSDSLARLKALFTEGIGEEDDARVIIHESLGEVLSVLNPVMQRYPALQAPDIFTAARGLITMIKDHNYEDDVTSSELQLFCEAIDQLALAFSSCVSEYLMGDMGPQFVMDFKTKSMNNIANANEPEVMEESETVLMSAEELDASLVGLESGLSVGLQRAKVWSKYLHDIINYMEKKAQLEYDYAKNLGRLAHSMQNSLKKEGFLPLQSVYCTALSHDEQFMGSLQATQSFLQRFIEPLLTRRSEHDKVYKHVKEGWHREYRRMTDSITNLRKSQALYHSRQVDHERARDIALKAEGDKVEKKKKAEEETLHKTAEAETTYKACVAEANYRQQELFKIKGELLAKLREQIEMCDRVIKDVTVEYFHMYHRILSPLPLQYQTLSESSKSYVPGSQYAEYVRRLPPTSHTVRPENFVFEPYVRGLKPSAEESRKESVHSNGSVSDHAHSPDGSPVASPRRDKYRIPVKAWSQSHHGLHSDTDSASGSSKSHESSPGGSPQGAVRRHLITSQSLDELTEEDLIAAAAAAAAFNGKEKKKNIKRALAVARDNPTDISTLLSNARRRSNTTFGVDFQEQVDIFHTTVPPIISKCLSEIENRGLMIKGIYRVSGVKSKVEHLCQQFDINPEFVGLDDVHPNIISNVLKLYLRQLPEPLFTFRLYPEFILAAKDNMSGQLVGEDLIQCLSRVVKHLPSSNFRTSAVLMHHLHRVADHSELNQMSASNLGIVFGPTLLRPLEGSASLASLVDTPHQTRAIELLITHAHLIFGPSEDFQVAPGQTPIETLDQALTDVTLPDKTQVEKPTAQAKVKSITIESDDSSLSVFESSSPSSPPGSASQPTPSEYVLPGSADFEQNDPQSLSLNGLDLDRIDVNSEDDEELPEISLPDKSKPQTEALSLALSPQCITVKPGALGLPMIDDPNMLSVSSKSAVPKSASTPAVSKETQVFMPNSLSAPMAMANSGTIPVATSNLALDSEESGKEVSKSQRKLHESHSTGDLLEGTGSRDGDEEERYASDLLTGKKKAHSQKLENIKFLTRAPSVEEVTTIMDELIIKSVGISPLPSPVPGTSPLSSSSPMPSPKFFAETKVQPPLKDIEKSPEPVSTLPKSSDVLTDLPPKENPDKGEKVSFELESDERVSSQCKIASSRKSILEEIPIPTLSKPRRHGTSNGGSLEGDDDEQVPPMTIPASPTIKRREITSKIPTSPRAGRSADSVKAAIEKIDSNVEKENRADRFRQEQRKLVSAIRSKVSSRPGSTEEEVVPVAAEGGGDDILVGGCAMSNQSVTRMEEMMESFEVEKRDTKTAERMIVTQTESLSTSVQEKSSSLPGSGRLVSKTHTRMTSSSVSRLSSSGSAGGRTDSVGEGRRGGRTDSTGSGSVFRGSSSPARYGSGSKSRVTAMPSSSLTKKSPLGIDASSKTSPSSRLAHVKTSPALTSPSMKREPGPSAFGSVKTSTKAAVTTRAVVEDSASSSSSSPKLPACRDKAPESVARLGKSAEGGDSLGGTLQSPKTSTQSPTSAAKSRLKQKTGDQPKQTSSPLSSPSRIRSVKKPASSGGTSTSTNIKRLSTSSTSSASSIKSKSSNLASSALASPSPDTALAQTTTASTTSSSSTPSTSTTSSSNKLSTDRTPRFV